MPNNERAKAKLNELSKKLLDIGLRNNLINFRDTKASTIEILIPSADILLKKADGTSTFEVYDPSENEKDTDEGYEKSDREQYMQKHCGRIKKVNEMLLFNPWCRPDTALKNIYKKAKQSIDETGVNIAYTAIGFVHWHDRDGAVHRAPILLAPVDIERKSALDPFEIKMMGEELIINPTFQYLLNAEFGASIPEYNDEPLNEYLAAVESVVGRLGWSVSDKCMLATFSFQKLNMYMDLVENAEKITENDVVLAMLGEAVKDDSFKASEGRDMDIGDLHNIVDADSSQAEAIAMAKTGKSFVLQGPPGTGKSQTITNIIAELLSDGKKVLFVSEKLAALKVVYDKLTKVGLSDFCLELHSHKANKKNVIDELNRTLKAPRSSLSDKAGDEITKRTEYKRRLDCYAEELHKPQSGIGKSLYQIFEEYSRYKNGVEVEWFFDDIKSKDEAWLAGSAAALEQFVEFMPSVGYNYRNNCWYGFINPDRSEQTRRGAVSVMRNAADYFGGLSSVCDAVSARYSTGSMTERAAWLFYRFCALTQNSELIVPALLYEDTARSVRGIFTRLAPLSVEIKRLRGEIDLSYDKGIYEIDCEQYERLLTVTYKSGLSRLFGGEYKDAVKKLRLLRKDGRRVNYREALGIVQKVLRYKQSEDSFSADEKNVEGLCGRAYAGVETDWSYVNGQIDRLCALFDEGLNTGMLKMTSPEAFESEKRNLAEFADRLNVVSGRDGVFGGIYENFDRELYDFESVDLHESAEKSRACASSVDMLANWCGFKAVLDKLENTGIRGFADYAIENKIPPERIVDTFKKRFYGQWADSCISDNDVMYGFTRIAHAKDVEGFIQKDRSVLEVNKVMLRAELSAKRPSCDFIAQGSPVAILLREGEKKRKQKSVRALMKEAGEIIQLLKPCFLMSPLSVSTFIDSETVHFDTVVFDEASQIFPQDAIGSIYRADQLIVVGDSRQMPPSNFFNAEVNGDDYDDETEDITDFESILDICSATMRQLRLRWHYRSKCEQLIAFSNKNFYDGTLITFPASVQKKDDFGVEYFHVDGIFDRQSRTNAVEAQFIADKVFEHIEKYPERSLGIVAFSIAQQDLIEKVILSRRQASPQTEFFFTGDKKEPFFIKNLETVQGDERDTIIFSVAYGRDADGRLLLNFGPLNKAGGERRLNVAVTRAKMNIKLVSSMRYTDIDLSRTSSEGARLLREYLDFAENGEIALRRSVTVGVDERYDSFFEQDVCEFLRRKGFEVDTQVGCSGYRIDLAVKRPGTSDYVLAVECDGASYHSARSARDRDRLRQEVLEGMGWRFYRIWSVEWFKNKAAAMENLCSAARDAVNNEGRYSAANKSNEERSNTEFEQEMPEVHVDFPSYKAADLYALSVRHGEFRDFIHAVLEIEAPLSEELLLKRIVWMFGREKVTNVVWQQYEEKMLDCARRGIIRRNGFLYLRDADGIEFRAPGDITREIRYICPEEIAACMKKMLEQNIRLPKDALFRLAAAQCGITRAGANVTEYLECCLEMSSDEIITEDGAVMLKKR